jgi:hypothetical protein
MRPIVRRLRRAGRPLQADGFAATLDPAQLSA